MELFLHKIYSLVKISVLIKRNKLIKPVIDEQVSVDDKFSYDKFYRQLFQILLRQVHKKYYGYASFNFEI